jgi:autotransporter-associated beta strand protein
VTFYSDLAGTVISGVGGELDLHQAGNGTGAGSVSTAYNLNGGTLIVGRIMSAQNLGTRQFNFNGGLLKPTGSNTNFLNIGTGSATVNVRNGGAKIDTSGFDIVAVSPLVHSTIGGDNALDGGLTKSGLGALTVTGNNTYTGPTTINAGRLVVNGTLSGTSGVTVGSAAALDMTNAAAGTLTIPSLSLNSSALNLEFANSVNDRINVTSSFANLGTSTINLSIASGALASGDYTLITAPSGLGAGFALGTVPIGFYNFSLASSTSTAEILTVSGTNPTPTVAYWTGKASGLASDAANNWTTGSSTSQSNWSTTADGLSDPLQVPGAGTDVIFTAANATGVAGALNTTLDGSSAIKSLTFDVPASTSITSVGINTNGKTLSVGTNGVVVAATSNANASITGNGSFLLNGNQSWVNNSATASLNVSSSVVASGSNVLTIAGTGAGSVNISGPISNGAGALSLTVNKPGKTVLSGSNTYTGTTIINQGTLEVAGGVTGVTGTDIQIAPNATDSGALLVSAGTFNANRVIIAGTSANSTTAGNGVVTQTGGVINSQQWFTVGSGGSAAGNNGGNGTYNLSAGTLNVFTQQMEVANFAGTTGAVNMTGGAINIGNSNFISMAANNGAGNGTFTQGGGAVTFFSDNLTTVGGNGILYLGRAGTTSGTYVYNLNGGTLTVPQITRNTANTATAILNLNGGVLKAAAGTASLINSLTSANVQTGGAIIDTNGLTVSISQPLIHDAALATADGGLTKRGAGQLTLAGNNTYNGPTNLNAGTLIMNSSTGGGALNVNAGALVTSTSSAFGAISLADSTTVTLNNSSASSSLAGTTMAVGSSTGSVLNFSLGAFSPTVPVINLSGALTRSGSNTINVSGAALTSGTITLVQYVGAEGGAGSFTLGILPNRITGQLFDLGAGKVDLSIVSDIPKWTGAGNGTWSTETQSPKNWVTIASHVATDFITGDPVLFDDTATGTTTVNMTANVTPGGVTVNNSATDYNFTGAGGIIGASSLAKTGTRTLFISNTASNTYSGGTSISAGTIEISGTDVPQGGYSPLGTGSIINNGVISVTRNQVGNPRFGGVFLPQNISGTGSIIASQNTILSGNNSFDGTVTVKSGATIFLDSAGALGSAVGGTTVEDGGRVAVYQGAPNFGNENFTITGNGPTHTVEGATDGAIYVDNNNVTMGGTITLAGSATVNVNGGTLLWSGLLSGGGNDLTKNGAGRLIIGGAATYGNTILNAGQLRIGNNGTTGNLGSGQVTTGATLEFSHSDTYSVDNFITGSGTLLNVGDGTAILTNTDSDFQGTVGANNGTIIMRGGSLAKTLQADNNGVVRVESVGLFGTNLITTVNITSSGATPNAQTNAIELAGGISNPFNGTVISFAGRNPAAGGIVAAGLRSTNGTNSLDGGISLVAGGNNYRIDAAAGGTFNLTANIAGAATLGSGVRNVVFAGAGVGTMSGVISNGGPAELTTSVSVTKAGTGTWTLTAANAYTGGTTISGGTLVLQNTDSQNPVFGAGQAGANVTLGYLNVVHGSDGGAMAANVKSILTAGLNQATWFSTGTLRSSAADATHGLGWKDDGNSTIVGYAFFGDANLDGTTNSADFSVLAANFNGTGKNWVQGDFNYDGRVNALDFNYLATTYGLTLPAGADAVAAPLTGETSLGALVPEPTSLGLLAAAGAMLIRRRRRA